LNIADNIKIINEDVRNTAIKCGRKPEEVKIIAVTKTVGFDETIAAINCGISDLGENRVQNLEEKFVNEEISKLNPIWHLIGHLQTNKVGKALKMASLIHSVDSIKLAAEIDREAKNMGIYADVLIELNISKEETKHGLGVEELEDFLGQASEMSHIKVSGLMVMAPYTDDENTIRKVFNSGYKIFVDKSKYRGHNINMQHLSMGMTNDYRIAIEEGATLLRIGTGIFH
jgi:pyridoxal phosphate enzyme (YggS family)